jgi:tRNA/rRNA methyltransferase
MGENIGAAARGMLNFGLTDLRLVAPRDGWPNEFAVNVAAGAFAQMAPVQVFETLAAALADCHYACATTARRRDMIKPVTDAASLAEETLARTQTGQKTAFVFGPERTGLENDEIALCHSILTLPANPAFSSLNLGQCVLLVVYEWFRQQQAAPGKILEIGEGIPAPHEKLEEFLQRLEEELETGQFFRARDLKPTMTRNIRNMFTRSDLTDQEVRTLHGMLSALIGKKERERKKAAR